MAMHPILRCLGGHIPLEFAKNKNVATFYFHAPRNKGEEHSVIIAVTEGGSIALHYKARLRIPVQNSRADLYLKALKKLTTEYSIDVYREGTVVSGIAQYLPDDFVGCDGPDEIAEELFEELLKFNMFFATVTPLMRLSCRLSERGGSEQYKKLLPTRLAELTVCGILASESLH